MLNVSSQALRHLSQKLIDQKAAAGVALRFRREKGRWLLHVDQPRITDTTFSHDEKVVLLLDRASLKALADASLTLRDTDAGPRLKLRRKSEKGESEDGTSPPQCK